MKLNVSIIGAGVGGLASAIRLAVRGHEVSVFEKSDSPGGLHKEITWEAYRWDNLPGSVVLPELMEELYLLADEEMKVTTRLASPDIVAKYFFEDGKILNAYGDSDIFVSELVQKTGEKASTISMFFDWTGKMFNLSRNRFLFGMPGSLSILTSLKFLYSNIQMFWLQLFSSMHGANQRRFKSKYLVQLFDSYASLCGSSPYKAPGALNIHSYLIHNLGLYYPEKGMAYLVHDMYLLAKNLGVSFEFNSRVDRILHREKTIIGVKVEGQEYKADIVISDIDTYYVYKDLLPDSPFPGTYFKQERSSSLLIFFWAMDREFPELELHNVLMSAENKHEFDELFKKKIVRLDPTIHISISSKIVKSDAPQGGENWQVSISVPENNGEDWNEIRDVVRTVILSKIERILGIEIEKHILHERHYDPDSIEQKIGSYGGSIYGNSSKGFVRNAIRHPNYRNSFHGLYFVGRSVRPGGGIPGDLTSAKYVDHQIINHYY